MRLLPKSEVITRKQEQTDREIKQADRLRVFIQDKTRELNKVKDEYSRKKDELDADLILFVNNINFQKRQLEDEVNVLEKRKKEAIKPLSEREKAIRIQEESIGLQIKEIEKREEQIQKTIDDMRDERFKIVSMRDDLQSEKYSLDERKKIVEMEEKRQSESSKQINILWDDYYKAVREFTEKRDIWEREYNDKMNAVHVLKAEYEKQNSKLEEKRKRIESQQATLSSAYSEARLKGII